VVCAVPAAAITWGHEDTTNQYPNVGTILASIPSAGACTSGAQDADSRERIPHAGTARSTSRRTCLRPGGQDLVSFDYDPFAQNHTPWLDVSSVITHPDFSFKPRSNWHDDGVLILTNPVSVSLRDTPTEGFLDELRAEGALGHGTHGAKFTVAGYGASLSFPPPARTATTSAVRAVGVPGPCFRRGFGCRSRGGPVTVVRATAIPAGRPSGAPGGERILVATTTWGDVPCVTSEFNQRIDVASALRSSKGSSRVCHSPSEPGCQGREVMRLLAAPPGAGPLCLRSGGWPGVHWREDTAADREGRPS